MQAPVGTISRTIALGSVALWAMGCSAAAQNAYYDTTPAEESASYEPAPAATMTASPPTYRPVDNGYGGDADYGEDSAAAEYEDAPAEMAPAEPPSRPSRRAERRSRRDSRSSSAPAPAPPSVSVGAPPPPPPRMAAPTGRGGAVASGAVSLDMAAPPAPTGGLRGTPPPPPPAAPVVVQPVTVARLTAASVGDADRRGPYLEYLSRHPAEQARIGLDMSRRVRFRVLGAQARPLHDAVISFRAGNRQVTGRTHADGYWDFFPGVAAPQAQGNVRVTVRWRNHQTQATVAIPAAGDGQDVAILLPQAVAIAPATLDLAFLIDVTGSMGDELAYVNHELAGIVQAVRAAIPQVNVRVASTFYRDRADYRPLEQLPFSTNVTTFVSQMAAIQANGGGDYPEDLNAGLESALNTLAWSENQAVRVLVVISDAPPQNYPDSQFTYHHAMLNASERGVRILPVAASGADRVVEFLFRAMGAFTSTPYTYLTDDSGIGGRHMDADTDRIHVEMFAELLTRLLIADMLGQGMHEPSHANQGVLPLQ